jgi:hypothetical protein
MNFHNNHFWAEENSHSIVQSRPGILNHFALTPPLRVNLMFTPPVLPQINRSTNQDNN